MNILLVGGGKVGRNLAQFLLEQGRHTITLIEKSDRVARELFKTLLGVVVVEGDGCDPAVLREAGAESADAVAAVTGDDEDNLVIALLCKREFRVRRVFARVNNPKNHWLFTARMGVDVAVDDTQTLARSLEADINIGAVVQLLRLREGRVTLLEFTVAAESGAVGRPVHALGVPPECVLAAVLRGEEVIIPSGDTLIHAGDQVIAIARVGQEEALADVFR
ncbi:MAG TPA: NAD-binding protein [Roseiflexaceae bacterium]|nr:NAD-binding protein [Roseiflexaceae bacterium]